MKTSKKILLPASFLLLGLTCISFSNSLATFLNSNGASKMDIAISAALSKIGDADYYLFWNDNNPVALNKDSESDLTYSYSPKVSSGGNYTYKITDNYGKTVFSQDSFELALTGDFCLSFDANDNSSSLTFDLTLNDENSIYASPKCFVEENNPDYVTYWITGSFASWSQFSSTLLTKNPSNSTDLAMGANIYLEEGNEIKITNFNGNWYGYNDLGATYDYLENNGGNIKIKSGCSGYYSFFLDSNCKIYVSKGNDDSILPVSNGASHTFTLDATKYASSKTYITFGNQNKNATTERLKVSDLGTTKKTISLEKYIYLNLNTTYWDQTNAYFVMEASGNSLDTKPYKLESYSLLSNCYRTSVPYGYSGGTFYRINPSSDFETNVKNNWSSSKTNSSIVWNSATYFQYKEGTEDKYVSPGNINDYRYFSRYEDWNSNNFQTSSLGGSLYKAVIA